MPTYDFKCTECGTIDEREFPVSEYDKHVLQQQCKCGGHMVRTIQKSPAIDFGALRRVGRVERS